MVPDLYRCNSCLSSYEFPFKRVFYYLGSGSMGQQVEESNLLLIPVRPAWCKTCASLCVAEDIISLRDFENAYGAVRGGKAVEYPIPTEYMDAETATKEIASYLSWRMSRRHAPRVLCCGGTNFQFLDVAQPLLKHEACEFGYMEALIHIGSSCGSGPGTHDSANIRLYDPEGELIGKLTSYKREEDKWETEKLSYPETGDHD